MTEEDEPGSSKSENGNEPLVAAMEAAHSDAAAMRSAELQAEVAGMDYGTFERRLSKSQKKKTQVQDPTGGVEDMNKMMLSNKQRKLYEKIKYSERKRQVEVSSMT
jgi:pescadillo